MKDGGKAFPIPSGHSEQTTSTQGMTMRQYYKAKAMQAIFGGVGAQQVADRDLRYDETNWAEVVAANASEMADAMIHEDLEHEKTP